MTELLPILIMAFATAGLAAFLRAISFWPTAWLEKKPLGCPVCMSGWSAFVVLGIAHIDGIVKWTVPHYALMWFVCVAVSALIYKSLYPPHVDLPLPVEDDSHES